MKQRKTPLFMEIAEALNREIHSLVMTEMPSIGELCKRYGVSYKTMARAAHELSTKGIIRIFSGKRMTVAGAANLQAAQPAISSKSSRYRLYLKIRDAITGGIYRTGKLLPKIKFFSVSESVTENTVCDALKMLEKENLIHKAGRKWAVGPRRGHASLQHLSAFSSEKPIILILWPNIEERRLSWYTADNMYYNFIQTFQNEIEKHRIEIAVGYTETGESEKEGFAAGIEGIRDRIALLGNRYLGTLLRATYHDQTLIEQLVRFKKPVISFHTYFELKDVNRDMNIFCDFNDLGAVSLALRIFIDYGHRVIGMPCPPADCGDNSITWIKGRAKHLLEAAGEYDPPPQIAIIEQKEQFWHDRIWMKEQHHFPSFLRKLAEKYQNHSKDGSRSEKLSYREALRQCAPSMWELVNHPGLTAIIAPNDRCARLYGIWCKDMGISFPADFSILGFDNDLASHYHPLSTIDFAFADTGYLAAHLLIGDIPVKINKGGMILSTPRFIDRGSVAPPKEKSP